MKQAAPVATNAWAEQHRDCIHPPDQRELRQRAEQSYSRFASRWYGQRQQRQMATTVAGLILDIAAEPGSRCIDQAAIATAAAAQLGREVGEKLVQRVLVELDIDHLDIVRGLPISGLVFNPDMPLSGDFDTPGSPDLALFFPDGGW